MIDALRFTVPPRASRIRARGSQAQAVHAVHHAHNGFGLFAPPPLRFSIDLV